MHTKQCQKFVIIFRSLRLLYVMQLIEVSIVFSFLFSFCWHSAHHTSHFILGIFAGFFSRVHCAHNRSKNKTNEKKWRTKWKSLYKKYKWHNISFFNIFFVLVCWNHSTETFFSLNFLCAEYFHPKCQVKMWEIRKIIKNQMANQCNPIKWAKNHSFCLYFLRKYFMLGHRASRCYPKLNVNKVKTLCKMHTKTE